MLDIGSKITTLRKQKNWSQDDLANAIDVSMSIIGKYERNENAPSIETAVKMAKAFDVPLDFLVGNSKTSHFDKKMVKRFEDIENLEEDTKKDLFNLIDMYIRDAKARKAYAK